MTKKYIVKNCPSIHTGWRTMYECFHYNKPCTDCTDCLIKQVVEKCKKEVICDDCELQGTTKCDARLCTNFYLNDLAQEILQLFTIEEVE